MYAMMSMYAPCVCTRSLKVVIQKVGVSMWLEFDTRNLGGVLSSRPKCSDPINEN